MAVVADTDALLRECVSRLAALESQVEDLADKTEVLQRMHLGLPIILLQLGEYLESMDGPSEQMQSMFGVKQ